MLLHSHLRQFENHLTNQRGIAVEYLRFGILMFTLEYLCFVLLCLQQFDIRRKEMKSNYSSFIFKGVKVQTRTRGVNMGLKPWRESTSVAVTVRF